MKDKVFHELLSSVKEGAAMIKLTHPSDDDPDKWGVFDVGNEDVTQETTGGQLHERYPVTVTQKEEE